MDQRFLDETVCRRPELFRAMVDFNQTLRKDQLCPELAALGILGSAFRRDPLLRAQLSPSVSAQEGWWDFSDETHRLLLIDGESLHRAALSFSAAVFAEEMALVLDKTLVLELRALLGEGIFNYALHRGRYQIGSLRPFLMRTTGDGSLVQRIRSLESFILIRLADGWPDRLRSLWLDKLRRADLFDKRFFEAEPTFPALSREHRRALWFTLKKLLLREAAPQWAPCFD